MNTDNSSISPRPVLNHHSVDLTSVVESKTETLTSAVSSGRLTVEDLDRFVQRADESDVLTGVASEVRIVRSLLSDDQPVWAEMEPSS